MDIFDRTLNVVFRFILEPIYWILTFIWKFLLDVMHNIYGIIVAIAGALVLTYLIFQLSR